MQTLVHEKAYVSSKGQMVIPQNFRKSFNIHQGTELLFEAQKDYFIVRPVKSELSRFFGACKVATGPVDVDAAIMQAVNDNDRT